MQRRLGRGLDSLLSGSEPESESEPGTQPRSEPEVELDRIVPNPYQPREAFDETGLDELRQSIENHGILQPVVVRRRGDDYELVSGERRLRAARLAGLASIPVRVREDLDDDGMLELALVENVQRADLDPIEKARGYRAMQDRLGLTQEEVATKVGLQRSSVANHLRLLELPEAILESVRTGELSAGHARALLGLPDDAARTRLAKRVARDGLSVRAVEEAVRGCDGTPGSSRERRPLLLPPRGRWTSNGVCASGWAQRSPYARGRGTGARS